MPNKRLKLTGPAFRPSVGLRPPALAPQLKRDPLGRAKKSVMRKIIVYIATSADGYIARPDGNVDWLNRPRTAGDYGMGAFYRSIDTILWGRKTCELALDFEKKRVVKSAFDTKVKNYVFSRKLSKRFRNGRLVPPPGVELVNETLRDFAKRLRAT